MGLFNRFKHHSATKNKALQLAYDNTAVIGKERHANNQRIITEYKDSDYPLDILAVAISLEREGASYRPQSIIYFNRFLSNPMPIPPAPHISTLDSTPTPMFSYWSIYSTLATLYEKEYDFDNAIKYLKLLPKESNYENAADYTRLGDVLTKIDVNKAVEYYKELKTQPIYLQHKRSIDIAYSDVLEKQKNGYKYKPRKRN